MGKKESLRLLMVFVFVIVLVFGCASKSPRTSDDPASRGMVYYLDGAGGNGLLTNWGPGVKQGLSQAGFQGDFLNFPWETGLGALVDQAGSIEYKRQKASDLAKRICDYSDKHPNEPIHLIGLSCGTAIVVFALEMLPEKYSVDSVVLLGSSMNSSYDLTKALKHVKNGVFVFTSERDDVLRMLVPLTGSADRQYVGDGVAGINGFRAPKNAGGETQNLYRKVNNIRWTPEFAEAGNWGGHTDGTNAPFVKRHVAPLLSVETADMEIVRPHTSQSSADAIQ